MIKNDTEMLRDQIKIDLFEQNVVSLNIRISFLCREDRRWRFRDQNRRKANNVLKQLT